MGTRQRPQDCCRSAHYLQTDRSTLLLYSTLLLETAIIAYSRQSDVEIHSTVCNIKQEKSVC